jgi:hypothetical protein
LLGLFWRVANRLILSVGNSLTDTAAGPSRGQFVVCGHGCVDCLRGEITFYSNGFYGLLSDARRLFAANPLEGIYYRRSKFPRRVDEELTVTAVVHLAFQCFDRQHDTFLDCQALCAVTLGLLANGLSKCEDQRIATARTFKRPKSVHALAGLTWNNYQAILAPIAV